MHESHALLDCFFITCPIFGVIEERRKKRRKKSDVFCVDLPRPGSAWQGPSAGGKVIRSQDRDGLEDGGEDIKEDAGLV